MIARHWTGVVKAGKEQDYIDHLHHETFAKLSAIPGFSKASILYRAVEDGTEFIIITEWESLAAIQQFAGDRPETAIVPAAAQAMMVRFDATAKHYTVEHRTSI